MSHPGDVLNDDQRQRFGAVADVMLPETLTMPAATSVDAHGLGIDQVLAARPDLMDGLVRAIEALDAGQFGLDDLETLLSADQDAYASLTTVVAASYYQSPVVRDRIGYPGQVAKTYNPYSYVDWVQEGLLDPVLERGQMWRDPSEEGAES